MATSVNPNFPRFASLIQACKVGLGWLSCFCLIVCLTLPASALTIHRSFRTREAGFGFGAGAATVAGPVDAKGANALDEATAYLTSLIRGKTVRVWGGEDPKILPYEWRKNKRKM